MRYVNNSGATVVVTSKKYGRLNMTVHPGESVVIDTAIDEWECNIPDGLTAVTP